ncbi:MAG: carboxypeptidase-like regulatory domain-containing protein [Cytophagales bacterium]
MKTLFLFLVLSTNSFAQEIFVSISGKLIDHKLQEPIPYATIYVKGKSIGTTSNIEGRFLFHVPSLFAQDTLIISVIGYDQFKSQVVHMLERENVVELKQSPTLLEEVMIRASKKELSGKEIVKKAVARIPDNYPMKPFSIEGFFRDLQIENEKPVELLEAALKFNYKDYNPGYEDVQIIEVRRSINKRHPINGEYDRQNSIINLMEDNYIKHRFGPVNVKGWKFVVDSILTYNDQAAYKISGTKSPSESTEMYIDCDDFSILKLELKMQMVNGQYYRRYLNLPDPYGLQETSFKILFEFQEIEDKMYLKYQREEDTYNLFNKTTNEIIVKQSFIKELFVNKVVQDNLDYSKGQLMNINKSVEGQAALVNVDFWKYYNAPVETAKDSRIVKELQELESRPRN